MAPIQNRDQFATKPRNKCFLMKTDKYLEYLNTRTVLKLVLRLYVHSVLCITLLAYYQRNKGITEVKIAPLILINLSFGQVTLAFELVTKAG